MKTSEIMKTKFNKFWKGIAVAAVLSATAVGYAQASKLQTATHYNEETNPTLPARWKLITPGSPGENPCVSNPARQCKAIQTGPNSFLVTEYGNLM